MSMLIEGVDMPKGTNMMLLISPEGEVWEMGDLMGNDKLIDGAKAIPAADVRWKWEKQDANLVWNAVGLYAAAYKCNRCGELNIAETNFCPNCGARMEES